MTISQRVAGAVFGVVLASTMTSVSAGSTGGMKASGDIVEVATASGDFTTLVTAIDAAGLTETLKGAGPFTVFAPTDEAFSRVPKETLNRLLADKEALTAVLTYHVVAGKVMAADVVVLSEAPTVQGASITIDTSNGVKVDAATVVVTDIEASNGVIHVIDAVILPRSVAEKLARSWEPQEGTIAYARRNDAWIIGYSN